MPENTDFIATELLQELKEGNARKDQQITQLHRDIKHIVIAAFLVVSAVVAAFLLYLNQYDYVEETTTTTTTTNSAEGVYAIVDSNGNVITTDLTDEDIERILNADGESYQDDDSYGYENDGKD